MGLAVSASRLSHSWVITAIVFITGITLLQPSLAVAKAAKSAVKATKSSSKQKVVKKASPRPKDEAKSNSKSGTAAKATASRGSGKASKSASPEVKRSACTAKGKQTRVASHSRRHARVVAKAHRRPTIYFPNVDDDEILAIAARHLGTPYRFGSSGGGSFDCSGFVRTVYSEVGFDLPHSASAQFTMGERVDADELQPGDLVFFRTYTRGPSHVGIYVGDGLFVHAASRGGEVRVDGLDESYYRSRYLGARRLRGTES